MLSGAIIGAVVGLIWGVGMYLSQQNALKKVLRGFDAGPQAARVAVDKTFPPLVKIGATVVLGQMSRMAGLAMLNDLARIRAELIDHRGDVALVAYVRLVALLGIAVQSPGVERQQAVGEMTDVAGQLEASRAFKVYKRRAAALAALGRGLVGQPIHVDQQMVLNAFARERSLAGLLVAHAFAQALEGTGLAGKATEIHTLVRAKTRAFGG